MGKLYLTTRVLSQLKGDGPASSRLRSLLNDGDSDEVDEVGRGRRGNVVGDTARYVSTRACHSRWYSGKPSRSHGNEECGNVRRRLAAVLDATECATFVPPDTCAPL